MMQNRIRLKGSPEINSVKAKLIALAYRRVNRAIKAGFYVEAIALEESLICDRLEAILTRELNQPVELSTIGKLIKKLSPLEVVPVELLEELLTWQKLRSQAVHQFVKVLDENAISWRDRIAFSKMIAKEGLVLLKKLKQVEQSLKKRKD